MSCMVMRLFVRQAPMTLAARSGGAGMSVLARGVAPRLTLSSPSRHRWDERKQALVDLFRIQRASVSTRGVLYPARTDPPYYIGRTDGTVPTYRLTETAVSSAHTRNSAPGTSGSVIHWAAPYDLLVFLLMLGRERSFRERLIGLARLRPGDAVLDIGCGTGTLAIAARRHVGPSGSVHGVDASPEMIVRATKKASKAGVDVTFRRGVVEALS